jgi:exodeoxyribonuclease III
MTRRLKLLSWNVNGIRACLKKGFLEFVEAEDPDILCLQEIKADQGVMESLHFPFPYVYCYSAERKGYSGTAVLSKLEATEVTRGMKDAVYNTEGRVLNCRFDGFTLVNVYTPNSKDGLLRLPYRENEWDPEFRKHLVELDATQPVISCGDFNVAHQEIDIARPNANRRNAGFTDEEREGFTRLLDSGFIDTFRHFYPDARDAYSWWSFRMNARARNVGWRIDYFIASQRLKGNLRDAKILQSVMGSDHCPVVLEIEV